jgi:hypothetical protein
MMKRMTMNLLLKILKSNPNVSAKRNVRGHARSTEEPRRKIEELLRPRG